MRQRKHITPEEKVKRGKHRRIAQLLPAGLLVAAAFGFGGLVATQAPRAPASYLSLQEAPVPHQVLPQAETPSASPSPSPSPSVRTVTVSAGESLWQLADASCGTGSDWQAVYDANKAVIGSSPFALTPGMKLTVSC
jgi:nucleoid-associated protein YgaU